MATVLPRATSPSADASSFFCARNESRRVRLLMLPSFYVCEEAKEVMMILMVRLHVLSAVEEEAKMARSTLAICHLLFDKYCISMRVARIFQTAEKKPAGNPNTSPRI